MTVDLAELLRRHLADVPGKLVLGFSGGLDSTVLLHGLVRAGFGARLRAVHVAHGLQAAAQDWPAHCARECTALGVRFELVMLAVASGSNLEDRAREVRRDVLIRNTPEDGALLLAHHADDQAETLLLRLLRGAGPAGLAAMSADSQFAGRRLLRPLLEVSRAELAAVAADWELNWVEDPTNAEQIADRNFLRHTVMPVLHQRWPALVETLCRNARRQGDAAVMLDHLASTDRAALRRPDGSLDLSGFARLPAERQRNLLHGWLRAEGLQVPAERFLQRVIDELPGAAEDRMPEVVWPQAAFLRFRDGLYLLPTAARVPICGPLPLVLADASAASLGPVTVRVSAGTAAAAETAGRPDSKTLYLPRHLRRVLVGPAPRGARLYQGGMHRDLRELWRVAGIPPWERCRLPVVLADAAGPPEVLAAPGAGLADGLSLAPGEPAWCLSW
ncbi:tRNA lysidine(34) synthetase TilS [Isoalcanivorax indicus]|uniref:tRNA lysidine(34) synthetase TilS n=1 Tax=Isoalcanivorax indicus TaxID=2202653 RepID=UPI000DB9A657|nr:tRNA lysidine(34) synthetase TilS [Isoalcanivorax indicus]